MSDDARNVIENDDKRKKSVQFRSSDDSQGLFNTSKIALTPSLKRINKPVFIKPEQRSAECVAPPSSITCPNYEDILRRVSIVFHQHIQRCTNIITSSSSGGDEGSLFNNSKLEIFSEENYATPKHTYRFLPGRAPLTRVGLLYGIGLVSAEFNEPTLNEVHTFIRDLFVKAQLSAECSIVCLIYVERLMEIARVPLVAKNWRPCLLCGLLLASKVWQDLSSWNVEISQIYPQFSLQAINNLEAVFCREIKWNLYVSSSSYAKYYFALRSLYEKKGFRRDYNAMLIDAPGAQHLQDRSDVMLILSQSLH